MLRRPPILTGRDNCDLVGIARALTSDAASLDASCGGKENIPC